MQVPQSWLMPASLDEARQVQYLLADQVRVVDDFSPIRLIGGMDVSNNPYDPLQMVYATAVVLDFTTMEVVEREGMAERQTFPYITGFLGFRESPALVQAFNKLARKPDLILVDGHGISHPRRLGIASHIGVLLDIPTIGVAKTILVGRPARELSLEPGSCEPLIWKNQTIGMMLRTKKRSNPLIISAGHRICLETAVEIVRHSLRGYRLPEPTRQAHLAANECRKATLVAR